MKKILLAMALALAVTSCTGVTDSITKLSGLGGVTQEKSAFDGATVISMAPNLLVNKGAWKANDVRLGARWLSSEPESVYIILAYVASTRGDPGTAFTSIQGMDINVDGKITSFKTDGSTHLASSDYDSFQRTFHTTSSNVVKMPLSTLISMVDAADCRIRVKTGDGYEDSTFSEDRNGSGGAPTARLTLREFIAKVQSARM